jgi:hypothetical protein
MKSPGRARLGVRRACSPISSDGRMIDARGLVTVDRTKPAP